MRRCIWWINPIWFRLLDLFLWYTHTALPWLPWSGSVPCLFNSLHIAESMKKNTRHRSKFKMAVLMALSQTKTTNENWKGTFLSIPFIHICRHRISKKVQENNWNHWKRVKLPRITQHRLWKGTEFRALVVALPAVPKLSRVLWCTREGGREKKKRG